MFTKTTKTLVAALVLAGASITFVANASAAPQPGSWQGEQNWMDRASNGGHHTGDTNGGN
jgi:Spy/CpxP family protein refolding chaperone